MGKYPTRSREHDERRKQERRDEAERSAVARGSMKGPVVNVETSRGEEHEVLIRTYSAYGEAQIHIYDLASDKQVQIGLDEENAIALLRDLAGWIREHGQARWSEDRRRQAAKAEIDLRGDPRRMTKEDLLAALDAYGVHREHLEDLKARVENRLKRTAGKEPRDKLKEDLDDLDAREKRLHEWTRSMQRELQRRDGRPEDILQDPVESLEETFRLEAEGSIADEWDREERAFMGRHGAYHG